LEKERSAVDRTRGFSTFIFMRIFFICLIYKLNSCRLDSSVGIATDYGLDGPGSNSGGDEISARPDRPWGPPRSLRFTQAKKLHSYQTLVPVLIFDV